MLILISSAKTMTDKVRPHLMDPTTPRFLHDATDIVRQMTDYSSRELEETLRVNPRIAAENYRRYREFFSEDGPALPAIYAYTGVVMKNMGIPSFTEQDMEYAQEHLRFGSGVYGLLRPMDLIKLYRMEYDVKLPEWEGGNVASFWRDKLTDVLIEDVQKAGGVLINLAASDLLPSFHWKKVQQSVRVITPDFKMWKGDKLKSIVIYLKMARGHLTSFLLRHRITDSEEIKTFIWEGFRFQEEFSEGDHWIFVQE